MFRLPAVYVKLLQYRLRQCYRNMTDPILTVKQGQLRGKITEDYHGGIFYSFCGIPYAKAPIGDLRFKAPQPAHSWEGIRDATKEGSECPSEDMYFRYYVGNEDNCLNLNVYTKRLPKENHEKLPVMVWIHGGAFVYGCNKSDLYGPHYLMTEDIVLVVINYRLGVFGFLSLEDESLGVPGNAGLKDQVLALKWVRENVSSFGGDPSNITIFGESAGAASVHYLLLSPLTKGLFQKAILQSGCSLNLWAKGIKNGREIAKNFGYKETDEKIILQKLLQEDAKQIVYAQKKTRDLLQGQVIRPWGPVVEPHSDGAFITEEPIEILKSGGYHQVPVIIGYNSLEGLLFELVRKVLSHRQLPNNFEMEIPYDLKIPVGSEKSKELAEKLKETYYNGEGATEKNIRSTYLFIGDIQFVYGIQKAIQLQKLTSAQPIYVYRNDLDTSLNFFKIFAKVRYFKTTLFLNYLMKISGNQAFKSVLQSAVKKLPVSHIDGVAHADDLFYLFTTFFTPYIPPASEQDIYIQRFVKLWTNFARCGNPTPYSDDLLNGVSWKPIESEKLEKILEIGKELKLIGNVDAERLQLWHKVYDEYS